MICLVSWATFLLLGISGSLGSNSSTTPQATTTTAAPVTTAPPESNRVSYVVRNPKDHTVCIVFNGTVKFALPYTTYHGIAFIDFYLPSSGSTDQSSCESMWSNTTGQLLKVNDIHNNWWFELFFENISSTASAGRFVTTKLQLHYQVTNSSLFPNATGTLPYGVNAIYDGSVTNPLFSAASIPGYYVCQSDTQYSLNTASLNASTVVHFRDLSLVAFGKLNNSIGMGAKVICSADLMQYMYFVPLVVGCVLGALILAVLLAYIVGRSRMRSNYQRV